MVWIQLWIEVELVCIDNAMKALKHMRINQLKYKIEQNTLKEAFKKLNSQKSALKEIFEGYNDMVDR